MTSRIYDWWLQISVDYNKNYTPTAYFYYDNIVNIGHILNAYDKNANTRITKYPAVFLLSSIKEQVRVDTSILFKPLILIVAESKRDYLFNERQENTYKPTLYPIYEGLKSTLAPYGFKDHIKYDRDYISGALKEQSLHSGLSNLFNDSLDGIEIREGTIVLRERCTKIR